MEESNLSHGEPNAEDAVRDSGEAEEVRASSGAGSVIPHGCCGLINWPRRDINPNPILESFQDIFLGDSEAGDLLGKFLLHDQETLPCSQGFRSYSMSGPDQA